ncbi:MAG: SAM-dependent methyltransferase [Deltaproteobacteria bacterium]|nr:SAM-dependent methyltransferase [Deltaproteobacteria bacterium]
MHQIEAFKNRLKKIAKPRKKWADKTGTSAYRLYDADIPELPHIVDIYDGNAVIYDRGVAHKDQALDESELVKAVAEALNILPERVHLKGRRRMQGKDQYVKLGESGALIAVTEESSKYLVNLTDYLDTGLFLDHRPLRSVMRRLPVGCKMLNLFCYTGSVSVAAAQAGAVTTSVDLSQKYLEWAHDNFRVNGLDPDSHEFIRADAREYLATPVDKSRLFDVVFLDPPTFSNSKRMKGFLDVQRDHGRLIERSMERLAAQGTLYFSTNKRVFILDTYLSKRYLIEDLTEATIPEDFRDRKIHKAYRINHRS